MGKSLEDLDSAAYAVADEYRAGRLPHLRCPEWAGTWKNLSAELKRRCPGFTGDQYDKALNDGFSDSR